MTSLEGYGEAPIVRPPSIMRRLAVESQSAHAETPPYNPGLMSDLEGARYLLPGTEEYVGELIATGVGIAEGIVERARQTPEQGLLGRIMRPHSVNYDQGQFDATTEQLHRLVTLSRNPDLGTTANDWGQVLLSEAWFRAEGGEETEAISFKKPDTLIEAPPPLTVRTPPGLLDRVMSRLSRPQ